jgi:hypothetical protein
VENGVNGGFGETDRWIHPARAAGGGWVDHVERMMEWLRFMARPEPIQVSMSVIWDPVVMKGGIEAWSERIDPEMPRY